MLRGNKLNMFANLILVMLMASSICQTLYTSLFMTKKLSLTIFIAVIPLTLLFFIMFKSKVSSIVSTIIVCNILIIGLVIILFNREIINANKWLLGYYSWLIDILNGFKDVSNQLYTNLTIISLALIITLFVYLFSMKFYNFYVISVMLFSVFFVQLQFNVFISNISFIIFILSFLLFYFFHILRRRSKELTYDVGNKFKYLIYIIPVCIIVIAVSSLFPIKDNRSSLPWLDTKVDSVINSVTDSVIDYFSNKDQSDFDFFSIKATGFGNGERLGGNIELSKTHVMNVKSEYSDLYLKATSKPIYDGHSWYESNPQLIPIGKELSLYKEEINADSNEFVSGENMMSEFIGDASYWYAKAEIEYVNLKTKSLFIPLKINALTFKKPQILFYDNEQMLSSNELQNKGFSYTIAYNNMLLNNDVFKNKIRKSYKGYYNDHYPDKIQSDSNKGSVVIVTGANKTDIVFNVKSEQYIQFGSKPLHIEPSVTLKDKVETIYSKYTQLPDVITPRVRQLANDITKDKNNAYDKAKAIETYLSTNYSYTLKPGKPPRKKDFVDYFLFDGKKGYCTYYATAMTVLLRCIDIPARYVEGYILPPEKDENGVFKVTNQQAHAWVEVYFEGFGWIPFEPTAPFVANMYNDKTISATVSSEMLDSGYTDYLEMMDKYRNGSASITYDNEDFNTNSNTEEKTNKPLLVLIIISSVIGSILLAFGILVLINIFKLYRSLTRIRKSSDPNSSVLLAYDHIIKVLRIQNMVFEPGETPTQFGIRVEKTFDFKSYSLNKTSFIKITNHYVNARYSKATLHKNDQQDMLYFMDILLSLTIEKMGKFKFFIVRYILGKI